MYERILVPVDGSDTSTRGLLEAIRLAQGRSAKLRLLHVVNLSDVALAQTAYSSDDIRQRLREEGDLVLQQAATQAREAGADAEATLIETPINNVGEVIVGQANEWPADIIVMGTHGRRGLSRMILGSAAEFVLRHTQVPVLLVRGLPAH